MTSLIIDQFLETSNIFIEKIGLTSIDWYTDTIVSPTIIQKWHMQSLVIHLALLGYVNYNKNTKSQSVQSKGNEWVFIGIYEIFFF